MIHISIQTLRGLQTPLLVSLFPLVFLHICSILYSVYLRFIDD